MTESSTRILHRWKRRGSVVFVVFCSLVLFGYSAFHGINKSNPFYTLEISLAWCLTISGVLIGAQCYKRGSRNERIVLASALAILVSSMLMIALFSSHSDSPPRIPQPSDPAGAY